jgi:hypothetical protein
VHRSLRRRHRADLRLGEHDRRRAGAVGELPTPAVTSLCLADAKWL